MNLNLSHYIDAKSEIRKLKNEYAVQVCDAIAMIEISVDDSIKIILFPALSFGIFASHEFDSTTTNNFSF